MFAISRHALQPAGFLVSQISLPITFPRNLTRNFRLYIGDGQNNKEPNMPSTIQTQQNL
jgi:hypothetical protein